MQPRFPESGVQPKTREIYDVFAILVRNGTKIQKETYKCQQSPQNRFFAKNLRNFRFFAFPCPIHDQNLIWSQNRKKNINATKFPRILFLSKNPRNLRFFTIGTLHPTRSYHCPNPGPRSIPNQIKTKKTYPNPQKKSYSTTIKSNIQHHKKT